MDKKFFRVGTPECGLAFGLAGVFAAVSGLLAHAVCGGSLWTGLLFGCFIQQGRKHQKGDQQGFSSPKRMIFN